MNRILYSSLVDPLLLKLGDPHRFCYIRQFLDCASRPMAHLSSFATCLRAIPGGVFPMPGPGEAGYEDVTQQLL